jgi:2-dehydropantoate 2-reductase
MTASDTLNEKRNNVARAMNVQPAPRAGARARTILSGGYHACRGLWHRRRRGYFGAQLALSGEQVVFVARGEHLKALRANGLRLETPKGDTVIRPVEATDDPATVTGADVVLVGVKAWQVRDAAQAVRALVASGAFVVPLQNGVEAVSELSTILGAEHVLGGMCGTLSWVAGPGIIRNFGGANFIKFGELDNSRSDRVER